ncbi:hypothetical protein ACFTAO_40240 [Paenibacillus rhizoplanae]
MGELTVVPVWIIQDIIVLIAAVLMVFYILDKETHPKNGSASIYRFCVFLRRRFFEITASSLGEGFYAYGRSIFDVI